MTTELSISLNPATLEGSEVKRDLPPGFVEAEEDAGHYDRTTLWYDAFWRNGRLVLVTPTLFNLETHFINGDFTVDGRPVRPKRIDRRRAHDELWFHVRDRPARVELRIGTERFSSAVAGCEDSDFFKGLNTLVVLQRDNDLVWIRDFLIYHREMHGLQAVLFFDNMSRSYDLEAFARAIEDAGISKGMIVPAPFHYGKYGRTASGQPDWRGHSMQAALLNVARLRLLRRARAVLQCDIDELVWCKGGGSIFDMTRRHPLGYVHFPESWRYARTEAGKLPLHSDHRWVRERHERCPPKWCIWPRGPLRWASWDVHKLHGLGMREWQLSRRAGAWHLRQLSTHWKAFEDRKSLPDDLMLDTRIDAQFRRVPFPDTETG